MVKFLRSLLNLFIYFNIDDEKKKFVFYSESKFYREHFIDLIDNLIERVKKK